MKRESVMPSHEGASERIARPEHMSSHLDHSDGPQADRDHPPDSEKNAGQPADSQASLQMRRVRGLRWFLAVIALYSSNLLYGLDSSIAANIQAPIAQTFSEISKLGWLGVGFMLGSVAFILPLGKAYAVFDTKWVFVSSLAMFAAGSALCGGAPNMNAIIVGRVWAGAGGAGMYLGNINYIAALCKPEEMPVYMGSTGFIFGTGLILGPVVGGAFADSTATWRWAFYINIVIMGIMSPLYFLVLPSTPRRPGSTFNQRIKTIDWLGLLLSAGIYTSFVLFVTFGGNQWAWADGRTIGCVIVFVVLTIVFGITQYCCVFTTCEDRLFPLEMAVEPQLVALFICIATSSGALFIVLYYIPIFFQFVYGANGIQSAVHLLPTELIYVAACTFCGQFMPKIGWAIYWYITSGIFLVIGSACMHSVIVATSITNIYGFTALLSLGLLTSQASYSVGPMLVDSQRVPEVIQFLNMAQGQGLLFCLTIASAVFQNETFGPLQSLFRPLGYSDTDVSNAIAGAKSDILTMVSPTVKQQALTIITAAIDRIYIMIIAAGVAHILAGCFLPHKRWIGRYNAD